MSQVQRSTGEKLEGIAFQFCKIATVAFLLGRFTLPVASALAAVLYVAAHFKGKHDTRCILRYPLLIAIFWGTISCISWVLVLNPSWWRVVGLGK